MSGRYNHHLLYLTHMLLVRNWQAIQGWDWTVPMLNSCNTISNAMKIELVEIIRSMGLSRWDWQYVRWFKHAYKSSLVYWLLSKQPNEHWSRAFGDVMEKSYNRFCLFNVDLLPLTGIFCFIVFSSLSFVLRITLEQNASSWFYSIVFTLSRSSQMLS
jgi:hypothetical protein